MSALPISVHVGSESPSYWNQIESQQREAGENANSWLRDKRRPSIAQPEIDWKSRGLEPRWVGFDTADCAAALQPSIFHNQGADEFDRFREGAASRGEVAVVISPIGDIDEVNSRNSVFSNVESVWLGQVESSVQSHLLGLGSKVRAAVDLDNVDQLLALRMLSLRPAPRWRRLTLVGQSLDRHDGRVSFPPQGTLLPIVETELGEPVVAVWLSPDGAERRYIVPAETQWDQLLSWLTEQALPELVPAAMRRARRHLATDLTLMTSRERLARAALAELEDDYVARKTTLTIEKDIAEAAATSVRDDLLYGTSQRLVDAVCTILKLANVSVTDVDEMLGDTKNADLLCTYDGHARLIEVKSASGNAPERAYEDLVRHLREWQHLSGALPVEGGVLIINHEHRTVPQKRSANPYKRPEFLAAQTEPIVTSLELLEAWRAEDWAAVRALLFGDEPRDMPGSAGVLPTTSKLRTSRGPWFWRR